MSIVIAGLQTDIAWEDPKENFRRAEGMATEAAELLATAQEGEGRLLVLPEMFATGFSMNAGPMSAFADETRFFLSGLARKHGIHVLGGYAEPADPLPANACSLFDPQGEEILHFRKIHPFALAKEDENYIGGTKLATAQVAGVRITPFICYDLRFPEPFRVAAEGTDLYCVIANWPAPRRDAWLNLLRARAIENQAFVLGVNRVGEGDDGSPYPGDSALLDPLGRDASSGSPPPGEGPDIGDAGIIWGRVEEKSVTKVRRTLGFLKDRKPELYRKLEDERP
jgi:predicted amidohydrolase